MNESIFRKKSLERVSSPEQLNDYIHVANPGVWAALGALALVFACALYWGFAGKLPTTATFQGFARDGIARCYLPVEEAKGLEAGMQALVEGVEGRVLDVADAPVSRAEAEAALGDGYAAYALGIAEWSVEVRLAAEGAPDGLREVSVITDSVRPIDFLLN